MQTNKKPYLLILNYILILLCNLSFAQKNSSHFASEIDFGNGTVFSTFLDVNTSQDQFSITSLKDADVRIYGIKAKLGRVLGKSPKKGIIVTISGRQKKDSLFGETNIPMFGKLKFRGVLNSETLKGVLLNNAGITIGSLNGIRSTKTKIDYRHLYPIIVKTVEDHIFSATVLQTNDWKKFQKDIEKVCNTAQDDIELYFGFNILAQQLPFSHLSLTIAHDGTNNIGTQITNPQKSVVFAEKNSTTAYLFIKNFSNSTAELAVTLPKIIANQNYKNLIVDLRNNSGGGIEAAFELAKNIIDSDIEVGYFLTNKLNYYGYQPELFKTLPELQPISTTDFTDELKASAGVKLIFKTPSNPVFKGNIYVLTNGNTASTCEPIVYTLKNSKKATIIGEKTRGSMLSASPFVISGKYIVMVPIADFYTYDGMRLDKVGVNPNIEIKSDNALVKALEMINEMEVIK